jgi:phenylalanyl-tRNA synthetase beta chain
MRIPVSWLREHCPTDLGVDELADRLSQQGVHVEGLIRPWEGLAGVIVAEVVEKRPHPNSDHLTLARLNTGRGEARVAAGVANWKVGDRVPYAPPGSRVPVLPEPLGVRRMGGEESQGMICSPYELGVSADHGGILILSSDLHLGGDVATLLGLDDLVLDVEIEPNRPDLMSVVGVAREAAAATGVPLVTRDHRVREDAETAAACATVEVRDPERCPRYVARVIRGVAVGPSPLPIQARLTAAGMRPISNVVDATNYAMLERGQPLHAFDLDLLEGHGVVVRRATDGERLVTLDDVERVLSAEDLVIADLGQAVAIAGVIGLARVEVSASTNDVLLEAAHFERKGILFTARSLGVATEASTRFERGVDPELPRPAADDAARLIAEWAGGRVLSGALDVGEAPARRRVTMRPARAGRLLATPIRAGDVQDAFRRLGIETEVSEEDAVAVDVPGYRVDLVIEEDLIEEVARLRGYDTLPSTVPGVDQAGGLVDTYAFRRLVRAAMVSAGVRETTSLSFASAGEIELMGTPTASAVPVTNPIDAERAYLRGSLVPGLLRALRLNVARQVRSAALFEVGHVFSLAEGGVEEGERVAAAITGPVGSGHPGERHEADFFDGKGILESLLSTLAVREWSLGERAGRPMHPGRSATVSVAGEMAGLVGELHPRAAEEFDLPGRVVLLELDVTALARRSSREVSVADVPRHPPVRRDLAFLVDMDVAAGDVADAIREGGGDLLYAVELFDAFSGPPLPPGKKNLAFSVEFRAADRTLDNEEVDRLVGGISSLIRTRFGGELRAG